MFTEKALDYLIKENLPSDELPRIQAVFRNENWKKLLTAEQIVARFSSDEILDIQALLSSGKIKSLHEYEADAFSCMLIEGNEEIHTEIELHIGKVEDIYCSCKSCAEGSCSHIRLLLYYIANVDCLDE